MTTEIYENCYSPEVGGYPVQLATHREFNPADWDMRYMTAKVAPTYKAIH